MYLLRRGGGGAISHQYCCQEDHLLEQKQLGCSADSHVSKCGEVRADMVECSILNPCRLVKRQDYIRAFSEKCIDEGMPNPNTACTSRMIFLTQQYVHVDVWHLPSSKSGICCFWSCPTILLPQLGDGQVLPVFSKTSDSRKISSTAL